MAGFYCNWINSGVNHPLKKQVEENGLKAICVAAFGKQKGEQAAKGMLDSSINGKKIYAQKIIEEFSRKNGYNSNSKDPQNVFNQALVANWSAYILNNHFQNMFKKHNLGRNPDYDSSSKYFEEVYFYENYLVKPLEQFAYRVQPNQGEHYHIMRTFYLGKSTLGKINLMG